LLVPFVVFDRPVVVAVERRRTVARSLRSTVLRTTTLAPPIRMAAMTVAGFFDGDELIAFDHKVATAYYWPADEMSARLRRAGFTEVERHQRPGVAEYGRRPHGALVAIAD
jgi:hypothetical protein